MFTQEIVLAQGYGTIAAAFEPLRSALEEMKALRGVIREPSSNFIYRYGGGRVIIGIPIEIFAIQQLDRYSIILRITRIPNIEFVMALVAVAFIAIVTPYKSLTLGPIIFLLGLLSVGLGGRVFFVLRGGRFAIRELKKIYESAN